MTFCAHFCLFCHIKKRMFLISKFNLPILNDLKKIAKQGKIYVFCESCTIFGVYFLHVKTLQIDYK